MYFEAIHRSMDRYEHNAGDTAGKAGFESMAAVKEELKQAAKEEALAAEIDADLWSTVFMHDTALMLPDLLRFDPALAALDHAVTQQRGSALGPLWAAPRKALLGRVDVWAEFEGSVRVPRWFRAAYRLAGGKRAELQFFADPEGARSALGERWAGVPFVEASRDPEFLEDLRAKDVKKSRKF